MRRCTEEEAGEEWEFKFMSSKGCGGGAGDDAEAIVVGGINYGMLRAPSTWTLRW